MRSNLHLVAIARFQRLGSYQRFARIERFARSLSGLNPYPLRKVHVEQYHHACETPRFNRI